eukprot:4943378-Amphidinium_carterae.1
MSLKRDQDAPLPPLSCDPFLLLLWERWPGRSSLLTPESQEPGAERLTPRRLGPDHMPLRTVEGLRTAMLIQFKCKDI